MLSFQSLASAAATAATAAARRGGNGGGAVRLRTGSSRAAATEEAAALPRRPPKGEPVEAATAAAEVTPFLRPAAAASSCCVVAAAGGPFGPRAGGLPCATSVGCCCSSAEKGREGVKKGPTAAALQQQQRQFGTGGSYGYDVFFRGAAEILNSSNVRLPRLPEGPAAAAGGAAAARRRRKLLALLPEDDEAAAAAAAAAADSAGCLLRFQQQQQQGEACSSSKPKDLHVARLPLPVHLLGTPYFFQKKQRQMCLTFYQHRLDSSCGTPHGAAAAAPPAAAASAASSSSGSGDGTAAAAAASDPSTAAPVAMHAASRSCCLLATAEAHQLHAKMLQNIVIEHTRGFACQLLLQGRGVRAYFDPEWPDLMVRLGVGVKPLALRRLAEQYATQARIFVDQRGTVMTVHGYNKRVVGTLTMALFNLLQANPYTMKGAHVAFHPIQKKTPKKK